MELQLSDPELVGTLVDFLERRECVVERLGPDTIGVELPATLRPEQGRMELDLYLRVWQSLHPGVRVKLVR